LIPPKGALIQIISLATCQGKEGNVKNGGIHTLVKSLPLSKPLQIYNPAHASGGCDPESLDAAFLRFRQDMLRPDRAVTLADYEALARETPGLALSKIKLIPLYHPGLSGYPEHKAKNHITLVIAPFSPAIAANVLQYLNQRRLITTQIHVQAPEYLPLEIRAEICVKPYGPAAGLHIEDALRQFFDPIIGGVQGGGWQFGQDIGYEDVYRFIDDLEWVDHIYALTLHCRGNGVVQTTQGDLRLPPYALIRLGQCVLDTSR
jgi:predicted phage baseplate assembly protein